MRLVIHTKGAAAKAGLKRYNGGAIYYLIKRKNQFSRFKKAINRDEKKHYPQKFVDTVVNGPLQNKKVKKRKLPPPSLKNETLSPKAKKFSADTTNRLINSSGSGIVLD